MILQLKFLRFILSNSIGNVSTLKWSGRLLELGHAQVKCLTRKDKEQAVLAGRKGGVVLDRRGVALEGHGLGASGGAWLRAGT